ncbi:MAG: CYTH domain-containing protein [Eubacteriales bacterium]|jgi:CYTH domain-containing protein
MSAARLEIERKYLVERPDEDILAQHGAKKYEIEQIYLPDRGEAAERIRKICSDSVTEYYHTVKKAVTNITRTEEERRINADEYERLKKFAGYPPMRIEKVRWRLPYRGVCIELDIYPFWHKTAIAEVELTGEEERVVFPDFIHIIREVTREKKYSNRALAGALRDGKISEPEY